MVIQIMKVINKNLYSGISRDEYSRICHTVCLADFDTSHPNPNRINRIASEINEYLNYKIKSSKKDSCQK